MRDIIVIAQLLYEKKTQKVLLVRNKIMIFQVLIASFFQVQNHWPLVREGVHDALVSQGRWQSQHTLHQFFGYRLPTLNGKMDFLIPHNFQMASSVQIHNWHSKAPSK